MPADGNRSKDFVDAAPDADGRQSASGIDPVNPTGEVGDAGLAAAVRASDEAACARFVRRFHGRMLATAKRLMGDPALAEDCVQDAFLNAFLNACRSIGRFESRSSLGTWLHRITVNGCRIEPGWTGPRALGDLIAERQIRGLVAAKIEELPDSYRIVLILRDIAELDAREVAEMLEISEGAVKVRPHRPRAALKTKLEPVLRGGRP